MAAKPHVSVGVRCFPEPKARAQQRRVKSSSLRVESRTLRRGEAAGIHEDVEQLLLLLKEKHKDGGKFASDNLTLINGLKMLVIEVVAVRTYSCRRGMVLFKRSDCFTELIRAL
jgi:hypothetical protein